MNIDYNYYQQDCAVNKQLNKHNPRKSHTMSKTQVTVIGEGPVTAKKYTHIKFMSCLNFDGTEMEKSFCTPSSYQYVELICRKYTRGSQDLMFAYDDPINRHEGMLYLGYFNEGLV